MELKYLSALREIPECDHPGWSICPECDAKWKQSGGYDPRNNTGWLAHLQYRGYEAKECPTQKNSSQQ